MVLLCVRAQTWFIEVNSNPCLELASPYLTRIIPRLLEHVLQLTVDTELPCTAPNPSSGAGVGAVSPAGAAGAGAGAGGAASSAMGSHEDVGAACGDNMFTHVFRHQYPPVPSKAAKKAAATEAATASASGSVTV